MESEKPKIFLRADANRTIGIGHVIRSLALAEMLNDEFDCNFMTREPLLSMREQIHSICHNCIELPNIGDLCAKA